MPPRRRASSPPRSRPAPVAAHEKTRGKKTEYEFGGPVGAGLTMAALPLVVYGLFFACNADACIRGPSTAAAALEQVALLRADTVERVAQDLLAVVLDVA